MRNLRFIKPEKHKSQMPIPIKPLTYIKIPYIQKSFNCNPFHLHNTLILIHCNLFRCFYSFHSIDSPQWHVKRIPRTMPLVEKDDLELQSENHLTDPKLASQSKPHNTKNNSKRAPGKQMNNIFIVTLTESAPSNKRKPPVLQIFDC